MKLNKKLLILIISFPIIIILDQVSKSWAVNSLELNTKIPIIENFFYLTLVYNRGAAWSILSGNRWFLVAVSSLATIGFTVYYFKIMKSSFAFTLSGLALTIAGTFGNLIDRALFGEVVDFLDFIIFGYDYPVFNFADTSLVVGMIILVLGMYLEEKKSK
jgi:signal peptidase II